MKMKTKIASGVLAAIAMLGANLAHAYDGTITFTGFITSTTCVVSSQADQTVTLPYVGTSSFTPQSPFAGKTQFTISVSGCSGQTKVKAFFESNSIIDQDTGMLQNKLVGNTNMLLALRHMNGTLIDLRESLRQSSGTLDGMWGTITGEQGSIDYTVEYYAKNGIAIGGPVQSSISYSMRYQ